MRSAWQMSALDEVPEVLVRFGRFRSAVSIAVVEDDGIVRIEGRSDRRPRETVIVGRRDQIDFVVRLERALSDVHRLLANDAISKFTMNL